jgi:hypothetical protein
MSGLLDRATCEELKLGVDRKRGMSHRWWLVGFFRRDVDVGVTRLAWLPVPRVPDGTVLLGHLAPRHLTEVGLFLDHMQTPEGMALGAAHAYAVNEATETP